MKKKLLLFFVVICLLVISATTIAQEQVILQFMGWEQSPFETKSVEQGLEQFMKENPNIKVEYTPVAGDYNAKLLTMMAGNAAPDVFFVSCTNYRDLQQRDVLLNLTDRFNEEMDIDEFIPMSKDEMLIDGEIYGLSSCNTVIVLFYNKDLFDKAGLPYPPKDPDKAWTWEEFVDIAKQLTIKENNRTVQYGVYGFKSESGWSLPPMIYSNGGQMFNDDYTELLLNSSEAKEALVEMRKLETGYEYGVSPTSTNLEQTGMNAYQMLQTGRIGMLIDGSWAFQQLAETDFPVGIGVLPVFEEPATIGQAHLHCAWSETEYPEEAWKLVKFLSSREYQTGLVRAGLWLPNRVDMYEEENVDVWMNPEVYPEDFVDMFDYFTKYEVIWPGVFAPAEAIDIILEETDRFFYDGDPIDKVTDRMKERVDPILKGI